jgi:hypothetical protein
MYAAAVASVFGEPKGPLEAKIAISPGSCVMTASAVPGASAAAATPPVSRSVTPLAMSILSMYFMLLSFPRW